MSKRPQPSAAYQAAKYSRNEHGGSSAFHSHRSRSRSVSHYPEPPRVEYNSGPTTALSSNVCADCKRAPVFDRTRRLCQACVALPSMKDTCLFCQRRSKKSVDFEDDVCQICAREFLLTNHSARCNSCKLFTVFRKGETQCLYCADDVSMHRKETPILCSGCQNSSLGFARKSLSGKIYCWICAFNEKRRRQPERGRSMPRDSLSAPLPPPPPMLNPLATQAQSADHSTSSTSSTSAFPHIRSQSSVPMSALPAAAKSDASLPFLMSAAQGLQYLEKNVPRCSLPANALSLIEQLKQHAQITSPVVSLRNLSHPWTAAALRVISSGAWFDVPSVDLSSDRFIPLEAESAAGCLTRLPAQVVSTVFEYLTQDAAQLFSDSISRATPRLQLFLLGLNNQPRITPPTLLMRSARFESFESAFNDDIMRWYLWLLLRQAEISLPANSVSEAALRAASASILLVPGSVCLIQEWNFSHCSRITGVQLPLLAHPRLSACLQELNLSHCSGIAAGSLGEVSLCATLSLLQNLRRLIVDHVPAFTAAAGSSALALPRLSYLSASDTLIDETSFVNAVAPLDTLIINNCGAFSSVKNFYAAIHAICIQLKHLSIQNIDILDDATARSFAAMPTLCSLDMSHNSKLTSAILMNPSAIFLSTCINSLNLSSCRLVDDIFVGVLAGLGHLRRLHLLRLDDCPMIGDSSARWFAREAVRLETLCVSGTAISTAGIANMFGSHSLSSTLKTLEMSRMSRVDLTHLASVISKSCLSSLTTLVVATYQGAGIDALLKILHHTTPILSSLDVSSTGLSQAGIEFLDHLPSLLSFNMSACEGLELSPNLFLLQKCASNLQSLHLNKYAERFNAAALLCLARFDKLTQVSLDDSSTDKSLSKSDISSFIAKAPQSLNRIQWKQCPIARTAFNEILVAARRLDVEFKQ